MADAAKDSEGAPNPKRIVLSDRAAWLLLLIPVALFLWTGARGIDFGEHWDEGFQVEIVQDAIANETLLPGWYNYPSTSFALSIASLAPELLSLDLSGMQTKNPRGIGERPGESVQRTEDFDQAGGAHVVLI